jgi:pimeloyl-ACP methyl ester carboxylesterase
MRPAKLKAALEGAVSEPAWRKKPSWYLVATDDRMIPPPAQAMMAKRAGATVVESKGSHAIYVSRPEAVASIIKRAARAWCRSHKLGRRR